MKKNYLLKLVCFITIFTFCEKVLSQTSLSAGDVAITSFNGDSNDEFSFILLKDISSNTQIYFTENGWDDDADGGGANPTWGNLTEGTLLWTSTSSLRAGTQVQIILPKNSLTLDVSTGTISKSGTWSLSSTSDAIIIYQGTGFPNDGSEVTTFIWAFQTGSSPFESNATATSRTGIPTGLTNGVNAIDFDSTNDENFQYNCSVSSLSNISTLRAALVTESNFTTGVADEDYKAPSPCILISWTGTNSNSWTSVGNWDSGFVPESNNDVIIPSGLSNYPTVTTAETINSLNIASGATLIATHASFTVTNNATYVRNLGTGGRWYLMSSPVVGEMYDNDWVTANSIPSSTLDVDNRGISWYNNASSDTDSDGASTGDSATGFWRYMENSTSGSFATGRGYGIIRSTNGNITFVGTGINTSNQTFLLEQGLNNFNLIGNPFTGYITLGTFHTTNNSVIGNDFYFWNGGSNYITRTSGLNPTHEIAPSQGFFVEATSESNVTFEINDVTHQSSETFEKSTNERPEIILNVNESSNSSFIKVYFIENTTTGFDPGYDGKLFGGVSYNFVMYSDLVESDGNKYQLQSLPNSNHENMVVPVGLIAASGKEITFSSEALNLPTGLKVYLEDRLTSTVTRIDEANSSYKVTLTENLDGIGRFFLHTRSSALSTDDIALGGVNVYAVDRNTLRITGINSNNASVKVFSILGKKVVDTSFSSKGSKEIKLPSLNTGVYIVQVSSEKGKMNKKIVLE